MRQVVAAACRPTFERASRASCTTSPALDASSAAAALSTSTTVTTTGAGTELAGHLLESLIELAVGQDARAETEDVVAQVPDRVIDVLDGPLEATSHLRVAGRRRESLQTHPNREERLDDAVVEFLPDPLALLDDLEPLKLPAFALGLVAEASVLDGDGGLGREDHEDAFVLLAERLGALLLGEVDVPEHFPSPRDGSSQERLHRRVVRRESDRPGVGADIRDPQGVGLGDESP